MRNQLIGLLVLTVLFTACNTSGDYGGTTDSDEAQLVETARGIHERVLTVDTHDDIPFNYATEEVNPCLDSDMQVDVPKMEAGGLDVAFLVVYVGQTERTPETYAKAKADAMTKFDAIHRLTDEMCPDQIGFAYSPEDVRRIHAEGKLVATIGIENGFVIGKDLSLIETYKELGAQYITLAHGGHNDIADSATPRENLDSVEEEHGGLSAFGEEVVAEMNRVGIMVDVSHISKNAMMHAVRVSRAPVIASHSSTRALRDHPRNMDDEQLLALKENGGVMQTVALGDYVRESPARDAATDSLREAHGITSWEKWGSLTEEQQAAFRADMQTLAEKYPGPNVADFVDHIDYAVDLIGVDHVGISSDFDGGGGISGWNDASETMNVTLELVRRGYSEEDIAKIWGGNVLRVWEQVERIAAEMQSESA